MSQIRVGVVGCGEIAQVMHLPYLNELPRFEVTAISDLSPKVLNSVGDAYHVPIRSQDYRDIFPHVDVVVVLTMDHVDVAEAAAHAGKHLFVEKPLSFSPKDCDRILTAVEENGVMLMVGYMKRFDPGYEYAVRRIRAMKNPRFIRMHDFAGSFKTHPGIYTLVAGDDLPIELRSQMQAKIDASMMEALGSGREHLTGNYFEMLMSGIHDLTVLRGAFGQAHSVLRSEAMGEVGILSTLDYGGGRRCLFEADMFDDHNWWDQSLTVYGQNETIAIDFPNPYIRYAPAVVETRRNDGSAPVTEYSPVSYDASFRREWQHFAECLGGDRQPRTNGRDAKADVELALAMVRAIPTTGPESRAADVDSEAMAAVADAQ